MVLAAQLTKIQAMASFQLHLFLYADHWISYLSTYDYRWSPMSEAERKRQGQNSCPNSYVHNHQSCCRNRMSVSLCFWVCIQKFSNLHMVCLIFSVFAFFKKQHWLDILLVLFFFPLKISTVVESQVIRGVNNPPKMWCMKW